MNQNNKNNKIPKRGKKAVLSTPRIPQTPTPKFSRSKAESSDHNTKWISTIQEYQKANLVKKIASDTAIPSSREWVDVVATTLET